MNKKLRDWFQSKLPEVLEDMNGPAEPEQISSLEEKLAVEFPADFTALYLSHNGQKDQINTGFFYGLSFLSLDGIYNQWRSWAEIVDSESEESMKELSMFSKSHVKGLVKETYANKKWVPFAYDWGGNFLGLDFDPDLNGKVGQVINFGRDEDEKFVLANSFSEFIEWYISELESGNYNIVLEEDGGKSFNTKKPASGHFLDSVREMFQKNA